jgi:hypothetical protein
MPFLTSPQRSGVESGPKHAGNRGSQNNDNDAYDGNDDDDDDDDVDADGGANVDDGDEV